MLKRIHTEYARVILISLILGILFWIIDGYFEYLFFYKNLKYMLLEGPENLIESLFTKVPLHSVFVRISFISAALLGGIIMAVFLFRRNRLQNVLNKSEETFSVFFNQGNIGMAIASPEKRFVQVNRKICTMLGYSRDELLQNNWSEITHSEDFDMGMAKFKKMISGDTDYYELENRFLKKDGETIYTYLTISCIRNQDRSVDKVLITMQDIGRIKKTEESLRYSEERYRNLYQNAQVGLSRTSIEDGKILECNKKMASIFGYSDKRKFVNEFILSEHYVDKDLRKSFISEMEKTGILKDRDAQFYRNDGNIIWVKFDSRMFPESGYMEDVIIDITEQKNTEKENLDLQRKFQQAQKLEAIGTLAGGIAHDFNNILSPIIGYSELLREDLKNDTRQFHRAKEILHAAIRAKDLVKQILSFSRQSNDETIPIQLSPVIKEALKLLRSTIPTTIEIRQEIESACGDVVADPTQIHQIIMNLATNAFHSMEKKGGTLTVSLKEIHMDSDHSYFTELVQGKYALLSVSDTGTGIEKSILDDVFNPYFTTKSKGKGTGLGLSVVHGIVKNHKGDIRIYSEPGKGTEVQVYLPIIKKIAGVEEIPEDLFIPEGTERILLVDDEEPIIRIGQELLERLGYKVSTKTGSIEALEIFKEAPDQFDLIITDMNMPNMDGIKLTSEIKKIRNDIPVILCTGFSDQISKDKSKAFNIQGFVTKPIIKRDIAETIRKVLDKK